MNASLLTISSEFAVKQIRLLENIIIIDGLHTRLTPKSSRGWSAESF